MKTGRGLLMFAVLLALFGTRCSDGFRMDEMDCEEAVARLSSCCPGLSPPQHACAHLTSGCTDDVPPVLTVDESKCILGASCGTLQSSGVCTRAHHLPYIPESSETPQPVCP